MHGPPEHFWIRQVDSAEEEHRRTERGRFDSGDEEGEVYQKYRWVPKPIHPVCWAYDWSLGEHSPEHATNIWRLRISAMTSLHVEKNFDASIHLPTCLIPIAGDRSDVPIPFDDKALRIHSVLPQNSDRVSRARFGQSQLLEIRVGMIRRRGHVPMTSNSDSLKRSRLEESSHLPQHLDAIRLDLVTPDIEQQSFGDHDGEMIAGPLYLDVTIEQFCPKHLLQIVLHLPESLLGAVCASDQQDQDYQNMYRKHDGLHGLSRPFQRLASSRSSPTDP